MQKIDKFHRPTNDWWFPGPLQCCNSVGWEEVGVPPLGRASNLAHSFRPRAGARLHGHGPTARSRDWAHVQVPQAQDRSWDASQQHGTATTSSSSCLARGGPAGGKTPGCQPQQGHPPMTPLGWLRGFAHQSTANEPQLGKTSQPHQSAGSKDGIFQSIISKSFWVPLMSIRL